MTPAIRHVCLWSAWRAWRSCLWLLIWRSSSHFRSPVCSFARFFVSSFLRFFSGLPVTPPQSPNRGVYFTSAHRHPSLFFNRHFNSFISRLAFSTRCCHTRITIFRVYFFLLFNDLSRTFSARVTPQWTRFKLQWFWN